MNVIDLRCICICICICMQSTQRCSFASFPEWDVLVQFSDIIALIHQNFPRPRIWGNPTKEEKEISRGIPSSLELVEQFDSIPLQGDLLRPFTNKKDWFLGLLVVLKSSWERKISNLHEETIGKSLGFAKGWKNAKRWEVTEKVG